MPLCDVPPGLTPAEYYEADEFSDYDSLLIGKLEGVPEVTELRIDLKYPVRLIWLCGCHEHRFRLTAWLCQLLKGVE